MIRDFRVAVRKRRAVFFIALSRYFCRIFFPVLAVLYSGCLCLCFGERDMLIRSMLQRGAMPNQIAELTGLAPEEIQQTKEKQIKLESGQ